MAFQILRFLFFFSALLVISAWAFHSIRIAFALAPKEKILRAVACRAPHPRLSPRPLHQVESCSPSKSVLNSLASVLIGQKLAEIKASQGSGTRQFAREPPRTAASSRLRRKAGPSEALWLVQTLRSHSSPIG